MKFQWFCSIALGLLMAATAGPAGADKQELPEVTEDGLHRVEGSRAAVVYADPEASLAPYNRVMLLDAFVAFRKDWARDQRRSSADPLRLTSGQIEKIKQNLAEAFREVFEEKLAEGGYPVATEAADDVLLLRPAIVNLDVHAPDVPTAGRSRTYVESAGEMTLFIELYDSVTGDLLGKAIDAQADQGHGGRYTWANSATNAVAARRILEGWAELLVDALDAAHQAGGAEGDG